MCEHALTICSVSFHSGRYLELNWKLTKYLNLTQQLTWVIIENTPPDSNDRVEALSNDFLVLSGYEFDPNRKRPASYHHGVGLNKAIRLVKTRFVLILDPDFYIVRRNWVAEVVQYMQANGLAFFGAPWHPKWYFKYRYFPCVHCMFIDLAQVSVHTLDFRPGQDDLSLEKPAWKAYILASLKRSISPFVLGVVYNLRDRKRIGASQDTGYHLYRQYTQHNQVRSECVVPVYRPDYNYPVNSPRALSRLFDRLLPDHLSYLPKRPGYYTQNGFRELGYADATAYGWEEFVWKDDPFGFHIRSQPRGKRDSDGEMATLVHVVASLTGMETLRAGT